MSAEFKKILVTGSQGFLGSHIVPILRQAFPAATVVGVGTHKELMAGNEIYRELALSQLSKEELTL